MAITVFNNDDPQRDLEPFATTFIALLGPQSPNPRIRKRVRKMLAASERLRRTAPELVARIDALHAEMHRAMIYGTNGKASPPDA